MRVLLVDDHTMLRQALRLMLGSEPDIEIVGEAGNGREAVALTHQLQPDIVLMDISMPVMDGIQATRAIHSECPRVGVIGLSMYEQAEQAGAHAGPPLRSSRESGGARRAGQLHGPGRRSSGTERTRDDPHAPCSSSRPRTPSDAWGSAPRHGRTRRGAPGPFDALTGWRGTGAGEEARC